MNVPLLIPCFNQLTFTRNLVNWYRYYRPHDDIFILDQASSYPPLLKWYEKLKGESGIEVVRFWENKAKTHLKWMIEGTIAPRHRYYIISDPDVMPSPPTPPDFVDAFISLVESGYHHAGFCLKVDDIPVRAGLMRDMAMELEKDFWKSPVPFQWHGNSYVGYRAPIDTTFALYKSSCGWEGPMRPEWWHNSIRMFDAYHLGWYVDAENPGEEMSFYFDSVSSANVCSESLVNHYRSPERRIEEEQCGKA